MLLGAADDVHTLEVTTSYTLGGCGVAVPAHVAVPVCLLVGKHRECFDVLFDLLMFPIVSGGVVSLLDEERRGRKFQLGKKSKAFIGVFRCVSSRPPPGQVACAVLSGWRLRIGHPVPMPCGPFRNLRLPSGPLHRACGFLSPPIILYADWSPLPPRQCFVYPKSSYLWTPIQVSANKVP